MCGQRESGLPNTKKAVGKPENRFSDGLLIEFQPT